MNTESEFVIPGDIITSKTNGKIQLGNGVTQYIDDNNHHKRQIIATKFGKLCHKVKKSEKIWIENSQKRYIAQIDEHVIGIVIEKHSEEYVVDIGTSSYARLPVLAFEGASRRNKPNIPVGGLVYGLVKIANRDIDTELTCQSVHLKKDWVTGETVFGELQGGYIFKCSSELIRILLDPNCYVLNCLGVEHQIPFEMAIGMNSIVWIKASTCTETIMIVNAIQNSEKMTNPTIKVMVKQLMSFLS